MTLLFIHAFGYIMHFHHLTSCMFPWKMSICKMLIPSITEHPALPSFTSPSILPESVLSTGQLAHQAPDDR